MKKFAALLLVLTMLLSLCACGASAPATDAPAAQQGGAAAPAEERSRTVTVAYAENIQSLDPHDNTTITSAFMNQMVYSSLLEGDHKGNYTPLLATEYTVSDDGCVYTFKLREGVLTNTGETINADDVVCTFQRILDNPTLVAASSWTYLQSVKKIDDYSVEVALSAPYAPILAQFSALPIIPDEAFAAKGTAMWTEQEVEGSGPWQIEEWVDGQYVHFTKNPNYWNKANYDSYFEDVYLRFVTEASTAIAGQLSGEIDAYLNVPSDLTRMYDGYTGANIINNVTSSMLYLQFQCKEGHVFNDPNVRKAFSMSIDRQAIADALTDGYTATTGITSEMTMGYDPSFVSDTYTYDPEAAKALLEASDYNGEEISIISFVGVTSAQQLMLAICDYAKEVGFNVSCEVVETAEINERRTLGDYDMFIVSAVNQNGDLWHTTSWRISQDVHSSNYVNDELKALIDGALICTDPAERNEMYRQVNEIVSNEAAPFVTLWNLSTLHAVNHGITGLEIYPDGLYSLTYIDYDPS